MKRHIFYFLLLLPLAMLAQQPFAPIGAKWYVSAGAFSPPYRYGVAEATGDTTINGLTLRQVFPHLLYQDSGRVYFWKDDQLHLIYDFTVTIGDSVDIDFGDSWSRRVGVVVQDTLVPVGGDSLRKITCDLFTIDSSWGVVDTHTYVYAERIGVLPETDFFLWEPVVPVSPGMFTVGEPVDRGWLRCYEDSEISYKSDYFQSFNVPCDYTQPVNIEQVEAQGWRVYPNPSRGEMTVAAPQEVATTAHQVQMWDAQGRMVMRQRVQGAEARLSLAGHAPGLYVLRVLRAGRLVHSQRVMLR
jgi:hypothetical protein